MSYPLRDVAKTEPNCEEAHFFSGEISRAQGELDAALDSYRKAYKVNPDNRKYADLIRDAQKAKTTR